MYSGGSGLSIDIHFVDIELSYDVLSPLPIVLSKHFNHPHPYIEIATAISDITIMQRFMISIVLRVKVLIFKRSIKEYKVAFRRGCIFLRPIMHTRFPLRSSCHCGVADQNVSA